ncbi:DUF5658 family protein [Halomicrobium katesii]|uniref:DUF5658 family protein n=1 Tax=Halomicrobium katesii TaxID=437163 RepID=UPI000367B651|nr:DUF5658 family protein [Halomicrobium katesii]
MSEESLLPVRREREMTGTHAALWSAILVATVLDVLTTMVGLERGLREGNAVVAAAIELLGLPGLWLVKFAAMVWLVGGWALLSDRDAAIFLGLFAAVTVATVVVNVVTLLGA